MQACAACGDGGLCAGAALRKGLVVDGVELTLVGLAGIHLSPLGSRQGNPAERLTPEAPIDSNVALHRQDLGDLQPLREGHHTEISAFTGQIGSMPPRLTALSRWFSCAVF